jgi:hypothetical protein
LQRQVVPLVVRPRGARVRWEAEGAGAPPTARGGLLETNTPPLARAGGQSRQLDRVGARFWPTMNHLFGKKKDAAPPPKATDAVTNLKEVCAAPRPQSCTRCKSRRLAADASVPSRLRPAAYPRHAEARGVLTEEGGRGAYAGKGMLQEEGQAGGAYGAQEEEALREGAHAPAAGLPVPRLAPLHCMVTSAGADSWPAARRAFATIRRSNRSFPTRSSRWSSR